MHTFDTNSLIEQLELARGRVRNPVIATDADGTLWSGDVGVDAFEALLASRAVRHEALPRLRQVAREFGLPADGDANHLAQALYDANADGFFPEDRCYELMAWAFAGFTLEQARAFVREIRKQSRLESRLHGEMTPVLSWARTHGVRVIVVSASPRFVVECGVELLAIAPSDVVGTTPEVTDDVIGSQLAEPMPYGERKVTALRSAAPKAGILAAFGDSPFDLPMLQSAEVAVAVRPKPSLRQAALGVDRVVELARS